MRLARGRVLDVGCGAGRVLLDLQERGFDAVGIDHSPGAVEVCRRRGARDVRVLRFEDVDESLGRFDTVVLYANNLGLLGSRSRGRRLLGRLHAVTTDRSRIIGGSYDPYTTKTELHRAYHRRNRERGRMGGQIRLRLRYRELATPWVDWLLISPDELVELVAGTGWHVTRRFDGADPEVYVAVLEKD
jgi:SAM-dependent methyltransferase